jgi:hypothetical protein
VVDLKQGLRDSLTREDTRTLLARLRRRRDLLATIAEEIDELLRSPTNAWSAPPPTPVENQPPVRQKPPRSVTPNIQTSPDYTPTKQERVKGALYGAVLGTAAGMIFVSTHRYIAWLWVLLPIAGGTIAGALSGTHRREGVAVLLGAASGWFLGAVFATFAHGWVFGAPSGAILGAIIGQILRKRRNQ